MTKRFSLIITFSLFFNFLFAQSAPFNIWIEPMSITGLGGLHSFAFGQHNGKWLILGGRLDGLHRRQPFASFDVAGNNNQIIVVDPVAKQKWTASISSLPVSIQEQISSTNMEFYQEGAYLYFIGGYGYSATKGDHTTYANLTAINVPEVINAVISASSFTSYFRQLSDPDFAVTGGHLKKINNSYFLVGGQKFLGRYNPMGPTSGPGFIQEYTNAIKKFNIIDDGITITINHVAKIVDTVNLHRRDYNVVPQILPSREEGLTAFSGVFQYTKDLPFLDCVNIDSLSYTVHPSFTQYYNHYHCANLPLYSESLNEMHSVFFGGIAQYYDSLGTLVRDDNVPFVKTIARVSRDASGAMSEYKLPIEMPSLLGAGSEFIPIEQIAHFPNNVIKLDSLTKDTSLVGYIYGGINSTAKNIFFTNTGIESSATSQIFKVYLLKGSLSKIHYLNTQSTGSIKLQISPNPNDGNFIIEYQIKQRTNVFIQINDVNGTLIDQIKVEKQEPGSYKQLKEWKALVNGGIFFVTLRTEYESATQKVIIKP